MTKNQKRILITIGAFVAALLFISFVVCPLAGGCTGTGDDITLTK